jgi:hypothetical protein
VRGRRISDAVIADEHHVTAVAVDAVAVGVRGLATVDAVAELRGVFAELDVHPTVEDVQ